MREILKIFGESCQGIRCFTWQFGQIGLVRGLHVFRDSALSSEMRELERHGEKAGSEGRRSRCRVRWSGLGRESSQETIAASTYRFGLGNNTV